MVEITLNEQQYRVGKLDAMKQFHVTRRIGPLLPKLVPALMGKDKLLAVIGSDALTEQAAIDAAEAVAPFVNALADMTDEASEYVITACMGVVTRQQANGWRPVWGGGTSLFDDMDMGVIGPLVVRVISESLGPFLRGLFTGPTQE